MQPQMSQQVVRPIILLETLIAILTVAIVMNSQNQNAGRICSLLHKTEQAGKGILRDQDTWGEEAAQQSGIRTTSLVLRF